MRVLYVSARMCVCVRMVARLRAASMGASLTSATVREFLICFIKQTSRYGCVWRESFTIKRNYESHSFFPPFCHNFMKISGKTSKQQKCWYQPGVHKWFMNFNSNKMKITCCAKTEPVAIRGCFLVLTAQWANWNVRGIQLCKGVWGLADVLLNHQGEKVLLWTFNVF